MRYPHFSLPILPILLLTCLLCLGHAAAHGTETVILEIILNEQPKGEYFVQLADAGDVLVSTSDLEAIGLTPAPGEATSIGGEPYRSLATMAGIHFAIDEQSLALRITALPALLPGTTINLARERTSRAFYPLDTSAFLNYALSYQDGLAESDQSLSLNNQLGARRGEWLFLTDSHYTRTPTDSRFVRLSTNLTRERRTDLTRLVIGDFFTLPSELNNPIQAGGISFTKRFHIDPYFVQYPTIGFSGAVAAPSEAEIYLDGQRMHSQQLSPGEFELSNISRYRGAGLLEVVLRDPYDNVQRIRHPFYLTDELLKTGLHDFGYHLGLEREELGRASLAYGDPIFSGLHRFGYSESLTAGFAAELGKGLVNLAPQASYRLGAWGVASGALGASFGDQGSGLAGLARYSYLSGRMGFRLRLKYFSRDFTSLATFDAWTRPKAELSAGVSYGTAQLGSLSLDLTKTTEYLGADRDTLTFTYNRSLLPRVSLMVILRQHWGDAAETQAFVGLTYHRPAGMLAAARIAKQAAGNQQSLELQQNPPLGTGYGYRLLAQREDMHNTTVHSLNPAIEMRNRYGVYRGELQTESRDESSSLSYRLSAAGAVAVLGGKLAFTRPISDSFALVKIGNLEGVRVYRNAQEIGQTDASGQVFVPALTSYFENQISFADRDIPIDINFPVVHHTIIPPMRSGSCIYFRANHFRPVIGTLHIDLGGELKALEFKEVQISLDGRESTIPTGRGGEFYLELANGTADEDQFIADCDLMVQEAATRVEAVAFWGRVEYNGKAFEFARDIPLSDDLFLDLGSIIVNTPASLLQGGILQRADMSNPPPPKSASSAR